MNKIDKFKMAIKSALISAVVVPAMGVAAHFMHSGAFAADDAKLSDRFDCAYSFDPKNDTYISYDYRKSGSYQYIEDSESGRCKYFDPNVGCYDNSWIEFGGAYDKICIEERYFAHPMITWTMYLVVAGLAYAGIHRRREKIAQKNNQKTR